VVPGPLEARTGGTLYDRRMAAGLGEFGWRVEVHEVEGRFPDADARARTSLDGTLSSIAATAGGRGGKTSPVVIDGLAMGALPGVIRSHADRLSILALVHHPLADETGLPPPDRARFAELESAALSACSGVLVTSDFTAGRVRELGVPGSRVRVAPPGTDPARPATGPGPDAPPRLLCVAAVSARKGHDVLVRALAKVRDLRWSCTCAGSVDRDPEFLAQRIELVGELGDDALDDLYRSSSLFVLPSHYEGYGMVLTEALARGLPVVSTTGGAIPGTVPGDAGVLVPPGDPPALAAALQELLGESEAAAWRRARLARAARSHAGRLPDWNQAARTFGASVRELTGGSPPDEVRAAGSVAAGSVAEGPPAEGSPAEGSPAEESPADGSPAEGRASNG